MAVWRLLPSFAGVVADASNAKDASLRGDLGAGSPANFEFAGATHERNLQDNNTVALETYEVTPRAATSRSLSHATAAMFQAPFPAGMGTDYNNPVCAVLLPSAVRSSSSGRLLDLSDDATPLAGAVFIAQGIDLRGTPLSAGSTWDEFLFTDIEQIAFNENGKFVALESIDGSGMVNADIRCHPRGEERCDDARGFFSAVRIGDEGEQDSACCAIRKNGSVLPLTNCESVARDKFFHEGRRSTLGRCPSGKVMTKMENDDGEDVIYDGLHSVRCCELPCEGAPAQAFVGDTVLGSPPSWAPRGAGMVESPDATIDAADCAAGEDVGRFSRLQTLRAAFGVGVFKEVANPGRISTPAFFPSHPHHAQRVCMDSCELPGDRDDRCFSSICACYDWCTANTSVAAFDEWVSGEKGMQYPCAQAATGSSKVLKGLSLHQFWNKIYRFSLDNIKKATCAMKILNCNRKVGAAWCKQHYPNVNCYKRCKAEPKWCPYAQDKLPKEFRSR